MARRDHGSGSIEQRSGGSWQVTVELPREALTGRRRRRRFTVKGSKRDAQRALRDALRERDHGGVEPTRITVAEWVTRWIERRAEDGAIGPRTAQNYRAIIAHHLSPTIGPVRLQDLRTDHVLAVKAAASTVVTPATVRTILGVLRQSLRAAVTAQLMPRNPADAVQSPSPQRATGERRALNEEEIAALLRAAEATEFDAPIRFALATGTRQGELLAATWESTDLETGSFVVRQTLAQLDGGFRMLPPKTRNARRTIALSGATVAMLRRHRAAQNATRLQLGGAWDDWGLVFPSATGEPWNRHNFYSGFRRVLARSDVNAPETTNWHSLRHTAASLWLRAGVDVFTVSRRLGHGSASFTMDTYGHLLRGQQQAAAEALDHLLG